MRTGLWIAGETGMSKPVFALRSSSLTKTMIKLLFEYSTPEAEDADAQEATPSTGAIGATRC